MNNGKDFSKEYFRDMYVTFRNLMTRLLNWILGNTKEF